MSFFFSQRGYVCTNINDRCSQAMGHVLTFTAHDTEVRCPECNSPLELTSKRKFNYTLIGISFSLLCLLAFAGWLLKPVLFPENISNVRFAQSITRTQEASAVAEVKLTLAQPATDKMVINY